VTTPESGPGSGPGSGHVDVAAYALSILDEVDVERFEAHLTWCDACATELERLIPAADALSQVDGDAFMRADEVDRDGRVLREMINVVALDRRRALVTRTVAVAAGFVLLVIVAVVGAPAQTGPGYQDPNALPGASASGSRHGPSTDVEPSNAAPGIGGPDLQAGEQFSATDPISGAHLDVFVTAPSWGTQLAVSLTHVVGPLECQLYAVDRVGLATVVASWRVDAAGYGTVLNPDPLLVSAATSVGRKDIARLFVRAQAPGGAPTQLVSVTL
jgi:hypothetical protein